ncbi:hypothetical protein Cgig2_016826 [Carnegiea gigantea]|uniref:Transcription repressor n=1 Tax=Carnegiea gigantea TaxID=171969 RepID=A0A9Q1KAF4_9CARY|nr:hypothetical protein Cgig2_016826 [Carnegiea gigantea]
MGMMKKLKLCTSCTQNPRTASFRASVNHGSGYHDLDVVGTPESWFTNSAELDELSPLAISGESHSSCVEAVIRGAQQDHRLLFEPGVETSSVLWAPQSVTVEMDSDDPRADFKSSMEEMVDNLGMSKNDWEALEDLLSWYLKVNEKSNHGYIVGAFVDLVDGFVVDHDDDESELIDVKSMTCFLSAPSSSLSSSLGSNSAQFLEGNMKGCNN